VAVHRGRGLPAGRAGARHRADARQRRARRCVRRGATGWRRLRCVVAREPAKRAAVTGVAGPRAPAVSRVVGGRRVAMSLVSLLLNLLWIVFGGLWMGLGWVIAPVVMAVHLCGFAWGPSRVSTPPRPPAAVRLQGGTARRIFRPRRRWHRPAWGDRQHRVAAARRMVAGARPPRHGGPTCRDHRGYPVRLGAPEARRAGAVADREGDRAGADLIS